MAKKKISVVNERRPRRVAAGILTALIVLVCACDTGDESLISVTLTGALKGLKLDAKLAGYVLKIAALDKTGKVLGMAKLLKVGNLSIIGNNAGKLALVQDITYETEADYSYELTNLPSSVDVDFVLEATKPAEGTGSDSRINFMLADFDDTFRDFNTGSSAVRSVPDVDDIQLSAVSINLSQVAISCETWNGKDPTAYEDVPPVAMLLIRRNGIELGSMAPPATGKFMFGNGSNNQDYRTFSGPLPGQPTDDDIDILVVIPALTVTEAEEGYFTKVPDWEKEGTLITPVSIKVGTENFKLTIDTDDVNAGTKTVDGKIIVTLPAQ